MWAELIFEKLCKRLNTWQIVGQTHCVRKAIIELKWNEGCCFFVSAISDFQLTEEGRRSNWNEIDRKTWSWYGIIADIVHYHAMMQGTLWWGLEEVMMNDDAIFEWA